MISIGFTVDTAEFHKEMKNFRDGSKRALVRTVTRCALFVEALAVEKAPVNEGRLRLSAYHEDAVYLALEDSATARVGFSEPYSIYVEEGFTAHFVPFHISDSLYFEALRRWGWRLADPTKIKNPDPRRRYLVPPGRTSPVWGVFVRGHAQPYLRPALTALFETETWLKISREEFNKEFVKVEAQNR